MSNFEFKNISFQIDNTIAKLSLNRPQAANALSLEMADELIQSFQYLQAHPEVKVLSIDSAAKLFCCGGDINYFSELLELPESDMPQAVRNYVAKAHELIRLLLQIPQVTVIAVNRAAAGFGLSLACCADILIADNQANFVPAYQGIGLSPDGGLSCQLAKRIGRTRTQSILLENRNFTADQALEWGLVNDIYPPEELAAALSKRAQRIAKGPSHALQQTKRLLTAPGLAALSTQLDAELEAFLSCTQEPDFKSLVYRFLKG